jgi:hypothetical protein
MKIKLSENPLFADLLKKWFEFRHPVYIVVGEDFIFDKPGRTLGLKTDSTMGQ